MRLDSDPRLSRGCEPAPFGLVLGPERRPSRCGGQIPAHGAAEWWRRVPLERHPGIQHWPAPCLRRALLHSDLSRLREQENDSNSTRKRRLRLIPTEKAAIRRSRGSRGACCTTSPRCRPFLSQPPKQFFPRASPEMVHVSAKTSV